MFPVRSYSVRQRRRNMETENSFKKRQEARRRLSSSSSTITSSHPPAVRSLSAGTTPQHRALHRALHRTSTSISEGAEPLRRLLSTGSEPTGSVISMTTNEPWKNLTQQTLYESSEFGSQESGR